MSYLRYLPYGCRRCRKSFDSKEEQLEHLEHEHSRCAFCKHRIYNAENRLKHEAEEHYCCEDCQEDFLNYNDLRQHSRMHLPRDKECFGCDRMFEAFSAMLIHLESGSCKTTKDDLDFYAQDCFQHKKYVVNGYKEMLRTQKREEFRATGYPLGYDQWECGDCERIFKSRHAINHHLASSVHDPRPYKCPSCDSTFTILSALVQHVESDYCDETVEPPGSIGKMLNFLGRRIAQH